MLHTSFISNGDPGMVFMTHELTLYSYGNAATFHLSGISITSDKLRQLANELDEAKIEARAALLETEKERARTKVQLAEQQKQDDLYAPE